MKKKTFLQWLFYKVLKQSNIETFQVQMQEQNGFMSKRRNAFGTMHAEKGDGEYWWLERVNARTILPNEICLDWDPWSNESTTDFKMRLETTINRLKQDFEEGRLGNEAILIISDTGSRGTHASIFRYDFLATPRSYDNLKKYKEYVIGVYGAELLKASDKVTINLECSKHWKTGNLKRIIYAGLKGYKYSEAFDELKEMIKS